MLEERDVGALTPPMARDVNRVCFPDTADELLRATDRSFGLHHIV